LGRTGIGVASLLEKAHVRILNANEAGLRSFPGMQHRLERIRLQRDVSWYNDR
jgi:UDP-N-acetylmuramoylalanine-D-glutamate ligase